MAMGGRQQTPQQQDGSSSNVNTIKGKGKVRQKDKEKEKDRDGSLVAEDGGGIVDKDRDSASTAYKRKRSSKACVVCRQKKVRCSGTDPCRHCIEFGESCIFDESQVQSTKTLSDLQLRIKRLEDCVIQLRGGKDLPLLSSISHDLESLLEGGNSNGIGSLQSDNSGILKKINNGDRDSVELRAPFPTSSLPSLYKNVNAYDGVPSAPETAATSTPTLASNTSIIPPSTSRKRARIADEVVEVTYIDDDNSTNQSPASSSQQDTTTSEGNNDNNGRAPKNEAQKAFEDEAKTLGRYGTYARRMLATSGPKHPFTTKVRATAVKIPPEEMYSTDEEGPHQEIDTNNGNGSNDLLSTSGAYYAGRDPPVIPVDIHTGRGAGLNTSMVDNSNGSGTGNGDVRGEVQGTTNIGTASPTITSSSAELQRSESSSSGGLGGIQSLIGLGPAVAKISSSPATELRFDLKGNLRYLGPASTSAVVAELADRQRWDVEFPVRSLALAQRQQQQQQQQQLQQLQQSQSQQLQRVSAGHPGSGVSGAGKSDNVSKDQHSKRTAKGTTQDQMGNNVNEGEGQDRSSSSAAAATSASEQQTPSISISATPTTTTISSGEANAGPQISSEFIAPNTRPKPWEIFSNLGVTVEAALPPVGDVELPDIELCIKLVDTFFEVIHPIFPVLHKTTFSSDVTRIYKLKEQGLLGPADAPFLTLFFALLACASLTVDDPGVYTEGGYGSNAKTFPADPVQVRNHYIGHHHNHPNLSSRSTHTRTRTYNFGLSDAARKQGVERPGHRFYAQCNIIILHSVFQPSVDQAVLYGLMAFFHVGSNAAARAWILSGQALRLAIELGLHRSSVGFKPYNRERRRRIFWSLFNLESLLASNLGRPPSLPLYEIDQERPEDLCLDDLMPTAAFGPPRKGDLAGFLHITQLHFLTTEVMRTISRHQRLIKPISVTELQRRLLKYETDLQQWYLSAPDDLRGPADDLEPCHRLMRYIMICAYPSVLLLLFMPFMPRRGEEATEFQTYALTRCVFACKDHVTFSRIYQAPIPPGHYLFNLTQHLLVSGALLLLICHRGLQDPKLLDLTVQDVDNCIVMLQRIGHRFVGGTVSAEMLFNMKDNMKHSETWKLRDQRIMLEKSGVQYPYHVVGEPTPSMSSTGPKRFPGILQPSNGPENNDMEENMDADEEVEEEDAVHEMEVTQPTLSSSTSAIRSTTQPPPPPPVVNVAASTISQPNFTQPAANTAVPITSYTPVMGYQPSGAQTLANAPNVSYYGMSESVHNQQVDMQQQYSYTDLSLYANMTGMNTGSGLVANAPPQLYLNGISMTTSPRNDMYAYQAGDPNASNYMQPSTYTTMYNTMQGQAIWPSDNFNFAIEGLDEIAAKSHSDYLKGTQYQDQFAFFQ